MLRQLSAGPRTRAQLSGVLARREVPEAAAQAVLDRFTELGYIDDAAFASAWVRARSGSKGLARRALASELRDKGVDRELIGSALEELDLEDEVAAARAQVERKLRSTHGLDREVRLRRLAGMLARKGHSPGLAFRVVGEALAAETLAAETLAAETQAAETQAAEALATRAPVAEATQLEAGAAAGPDELGRSGRPSPRSDPRSAHPSPTP